MAELKWGLSLARRAFRGAGKVTLTTAAGETAEGRGIVSALRQETGEPGDRRHFLGALGRPLYHFVGYLPMAEPGAELTQGGESYTVLDLRRISLGGREICVRALLERRKA